MRKPAIILLIWLLSSCSVAYGAGTSGGRILALNPNAKITALGGAYTARATEAGAFVLNPAGLGRIYGPELSFSYSMYYLDTSMNTFAGGTNIGSIGVGIERKAFGAKEELRDEYGMGDGDFDINFVQTSMGFGYPVSRRVSVGASMNLITEEIHDYDDMAMAFNFGTHIVGFRGDSFAIAVKNLGTGIKLDKKEAGLPLKLVLAGAHRMGDFHLSWEAFRSTELDFGWRAGLEAEVMNSLILRGGLKYELGPDFSAGFGIPYRRWSFDYAFSPHIDLGGAHRMSFGVHF